MATSLEQLKAKMLERKALNVTPTSMAPSVPIHTTPVPTDEADRKVEGQGQLTGSAQQVMERIHYLKESMEKQLPGYEGMLHSVHRQLASDPELTHILREDQIGTVIQAMLKHKNIVITQESAAKSSKKSLKQTTVDDI